MSPRSNKVDNTVIFNLLHDFWLQNFHDGHGHFEEYIEALAKP